MDSILTSIKELLGIQADYTHFDAQIVMHINTVLNKLTQLGVGPTEGFFITDDKAIWDDFIADDTKFLSVKTYIYLNVKLVFDPPLTASVLASMENQIKELEWRLNVAAETT